jgi:hypothetical protein
MYMPMIDVPEEGGAMLFADGSHAGGPLLNGSISETAGAEFERLAEERGFSIQSHPLKAGDPPPVR